MAIIYEEEGGEGIRAAYTVERMWYLTLELIQTLNLYKAWASQEASHMRATALHGLLLARRSQGSRYPDEIYKVDGLELVVDSYSTVHLSKFEHLSEVGKGGNNEGGDLVMPARPWGLGFQGFRV